MAELPDMARWFCELSTEEQAEFFVEVAKIASTWEGVPDRQWFGIGTTLAGAIRSKKEWASDARKMIEGILAGLDWNKK